MIKGLLLDAAADGGGGAAGTPAPLIGADGNFAADWYKNPAAGIPAEMQAEPILANTKNLAGLVSQTISAQKMVGADKIAIPGKNATPEEIRGVFAKLGLPKDVNGYIDEKGQAILARPDGLPDELWSDERNKQFADIALNQIHLLPWQLKKLNDWYNGQILTGIKAQADGAKQEMIAFEASLNKEMGKAKPEILKQIDMVLEHYAQKKPESFVRLQQSGILKNMDVVSFLADVAKDLDIDRGRGFELTGITPGDIKSQIATIRASEEFKNAQHPGNAAANEKLANLYTALEQSQVGQSA